MRGAITIIILLCCIPALKSQQPDSLILRGEEIIGNRLEYLEEAADDGLDLGELNEELENLLHDPVMLNEADKKDLRRLQLLNDIQIRNLVDYREKYGTFYSIYELAAIEGFGRNTIEKIMPFVSLEKPKPRLKNSAGFFRGRHELIMRFQRKGLRSSGYFPPADSLQTDQSSSFYMGDANRYYLRYGYTAYDHLRIGITAEKDPGEAFFKAKKGITDSIAGLVKKNYGFDFYSGFAELKNIGILRSLILGDYHIRLGQGLVLWSGLGFSGGSDPAGFKRYAPGIRPSTSSNENLFMRGMATQLEWRKLEVIAFYSRNRVDANISEGSVTSLQESGYHRSLGEILDKQALLQQHAGGHLQFSARHFRAGATAFTTRYGHSFIRGTEPYQVFDFHGKENLNLGVDLDILLRRTSLYGEFGWSRNGGWALLAGISHNTENGSLLTAVFREYRKDYQNFLAGARGRRDGNRNERGLSLAFETAISRKWLMQLSAEHYSIPWMSSRSINPVSGQEFILLVNYIPSGESRIAMKYRIRSEELKSSDNDTWLDEAGKQGKQSLRLQARHMLSPHFSMKGQFDHNWTENCFSGKSSGSLLLTDLYYHPPGHSLKISFRYALFRCGNYDSRLYAYENDVRYAFSMPAYYGTGFRTYVLISYAPLRQLQFWLRLSLSSFTDRDVVSSGTEEIESNKVPEIKVQMRLKL